MSFRKTILSAIVFALLLAVYQWDVARLERVAIRKESDERLFTFEVRDIRRITLKNEHGDFQIERRADQDWWLLRPIETRADKDQVEPMLENLRGAKKRNPFDAPADIKPFGLDAPAVRVEVEAVENGTPRTVAVVFGTTAAQSYQVYARIEGEPTLFTLSDYSMRQCIKTLLNLRDKTLIATPPEQVLRLEIQGITTALLVERTSPERSEWTLGANRDRADRDAVENLLRTINNSKATEIYDAPTNGTEYFGTDPAAAQATITVTRTLAPSSPFFPSSGAKDGGAQPDAETRILRIGKATPDGLGLYCQLEGDPRILLARTTFLSDIEKNPRELRDRRLLVFDEEALRSLRVHSSTGEVAAERRSPETQWVFTVPSEYPASEKKFAQFVTDLLSLRAKEFIADADEAPEEKLEDYGLHIPSLEVRLAVADSPTTLGFDFGSTNADLGIVYVRRLADNAILGLDFTRVSDVYKFQRDLEDRTLVDFDPDRVERLRITMKTSGGPATIAFQKRRTSWRAEFEDGKSRTIQPFDISTFLGDLADLEFADVFDPEADDATGGGLADPAVRLVLLDKDNTELGRLDVGRRRGFRQIMGTVQGAYLIDLTNAERFTRGMSLLLEKVGQAPPDEIARDGAGT
jgi:hypothetical protein